MYTRRIRSLVGLLAIVAGAVILTSALLSSVSPQSPPATRAVDADRSGTLGPSVAPPSDHGNFTLGAPAPTGTYSANTKMTVSYQVQVPSFESGAAAGLVHVPETEATFNTAGGEIHVFLPAENFTITGSGPTGLTPNSTTLLASSGTFTTGVPTFTTEGFALTASWPYGGPEVQVQWSWTLSGATTGASGWTPWASVDPTEVAWISGTPNEFVTLGSLYNFCLSGPVAGRTFALHITTNDPSEIFNGAEATAPASTTKPFCWTTVMPTGVPPQQAIIHVWEFGSLTFLLFQVPIDLLAVSPPPASAGSSFAQVVLEPTFWVVLLVIAAVGVTVALQLRSWARSSKRSHPTSSTNGAKGAPRKEGGPKGPGPDPSPPAPTLSTNSPSAPSPADPVLAGSGALAAPLPVEPGPSELRTTDALKDPESPSPTPSINEEARELLLKVKSMRAQGMNVDSLIPYLRKLTADLRLERTEEAKISMSEAESVLTELVGASPSIASLEQTVASSPPSATPSEITIPSPSTPLPLEAPSPAEALPPSPIASGWPDTPVPTPEPAEPVSVGKRTRTRSRSTDRSPGTGSTAN